VKSTLTRWMGFIILSELVKKWETSLPLSAKRTMAWAERCFFLVRVFFIESRSIRSPDHRTHLLNPSRRLLFAVGDPDVFDLGGVLEEEAEFGLLWVEPVDGAAFVGEDLF
jgi:hypothetical protein